MKTKSNEQNLNLTSKVITNEEHRRFCSESYLSRVLIKKLTEQMEIGLIQLESYYSEVKVITSSVHLSLMNFL